ncbi:MAG: VPLPA-CTERM sorting domain-containing protein [Pseudomonadota bacterium]
MKLRNVLAATVLVLCAATAGQAATIGLGGAKNVEVNGSFYDVTFTGGSCNDVFGDCADANNFFFSSSNDASDASAVLAALISGALDTLDPADFEGIQALNGLGSAFLLTPYAFANDKTLTRTVVLSNTSPLQTSGIMVSNLDTNVSTWSWAVWSEAEPPAPVPLPAGLPLVLTGLAGLAGLRVRSKRAPRG